MIVGHYPVIEWFQTECSYAKMAEGIDWENEIGREEEEEDTVMKNIVDEVRRIGL